MRAIKPAYAKLDPAHVFDGLFVPTGGKKRGKLLVEPRRFGDLEIGFQGFDQLADRRQRRRDLRDAAGTGNGTATSGARDPH